MVLISSTDPSSEELKPGEGIGSSTRAPNICASGDEVCFGKPGRAREEIACSTSTFSRSRSSAFRLSIHQIAAHESQASVLIECTICPVSKPRLVRASRRVCSFGVERGEGEGRERRER